MRTGIGFPRGSTASSGWVRPPTCVWGIRRFSPIAGIVNNLTIERPGDYSFVLKVNGLELGRYTIRALKAPLQINVGSPSPES